MIVYYMMVEDINNLLTKLERELIKLAQGKNTMIEVKLTEKHSVKINTIMEKNVLMKLLYNNELSAIKIGGLCIYLHSDPDGAPDVVYGDSFRIAKAKIDIIDENSNSIEKDILVDVRYIAQQLLSVPLSNGEDGEFSYIDWDKKFVTVATNLADINSRVKFKLDDIPELKSENVEMCSFVHPEVENIGLDENNNFQAIIKTKIIKAKLFVDVENPLNTHTIEV